MSTGTAGPWDRRVLAAAVVLELAGLAVLILGWVLISGTVVFPDQWAPLGVAMTGTALAGAGNTVWFVAGRRSVTVRRLRLAERLADRRVDGHGER